MKKLLIFLVVAGSLLAGGSQAQSAYAGGGLALNLVTGTLLFGFDLQVGSDDLFTKDFGGRFDAQLFVTPGFNLALGLDVYGRFSTGRIAPYLGFGGQIVPTTDPLLFIVHGLAGVDFRISRPVSLFLELTPGLAIQGGATAFDIGINLGVRARF